MIYPAATTRDLLIAAGRRRSGFALTRAGEVQPMDPDACVFDLLPDGELVHAEAVFSVVD